MTPTDKSLTRTFKFSYPNISGQIDLFCVTPNLRGILANLEGANDYINVLERYINASIIQHHRFSEILKMQNARMLVGIGRNANDVNNFSALLEMQFTELHFYLIAIDKVVKHLRRFNDAMIPLGEKIDQDIWRQRLPALRQLRLAAFGHKLARNHFEHMDERIFRGLGPGLEFEQKNSQTILKYVNVSGPQRTEIEIGALVSAYDRFVNWLYSLPDATA